MFISAGSRKYSRKSQKRERQRRLQKLNLRKRNPPRRKQRSQIEVESESALRSIAPDFNLLASVKCRGTARSDNPQFDFVSRFFAPAVGVNEDPLTGSAHCLLAPYWGARLGKSKMVGYQVSSRGGTVQVEVRGGRVMLGGEGVVFARGSIAEHSSR
jgi:predicted PhzF superfamily epimerase YddE/YHI9